MPSPGYPRQTVLPLHQQNDRPRALVVAQVCRGWLKCLETWGEVVVVVVEEEEEEEEVCQI
jgi:hypothetical protein